MVPPSTLQQQVCQPHALHGRFKTGGRGEGGGPQAQAPVVSNPAIHHSNKPFIAFRRRSGHGLTIFGNMNT